MRLALTCALTAALVAAGCGPQYETRVETTTRTEPTPAAETTGTAPAVPPTSAPAAKAPETPSPTAKAPPTAPPAPAARHGIRPGNLAPDYAATAHRFDGEGVADEPVALRKMDGVVVWLVSSSTCPFTKRYAPHVVEMEKEYEGRARFVHVYPNRTESSDSKRAFHKAKGFRSSFVEDRDAAFAKLYGIKKTPEIVLVRKDGTIAYRGAIDDSGGDSARAEKRYLKDALNAVLAGKPVAVTETVPAG